MHQVLMTGAHAIDTGTLSASDLFNAVRPTLDYVLPSDWNKSSVSDVLGIVAHAIDTGEISASAVFGAAKPFIREAGFENKELLLKGLEVIARQIDAGDFSLDQLFSSILNR